MTYKESLTQAMTDLAKDPLVRFIGYGVRVGGRAAGTLAGVAESQLIETPVAENLMVGMATGMALAGLRPVVFIERMDFILNAMDAIVNHLDKIEVLSQGQFRPSVILRVVVGNRTKPLFTGVTHVQDFTDAISKMVSFPVVSLAKPEEIVPQYRVAYQTIAAEGAARKSYMLVEYKDLL
jgi:pyruvate/2-oxoglutarate/acetoin dehydrogenase E1 component